MGHEAMPIEKVYCCGNDNNDVLLATMMNGNNNNWNNPFVYLVWMMMAQRMGWNTGCDGNNCYNGQMASFQTQMQDNHNTDLVMRGLDGVEGAIRELATTLGYDFNTLNSAICDVRNGISKLSGEIGFSAERIINAVNLGNCNLLSALKDCCCSTQKELLVQSNLLQRGQDTINTSIERGFSATAFQAQQDKCELIRSGEMNTQRIIDTLNTHWKNEQAREIQDLKAELSQYKQTEAIIARLRGNGHCGNECGGFNGGTF